MEGTPGHNEFEGFRSRSDYPGNTSAINLGKASNSSSIMLGALVNLSALNIAESAAIILISLNIFLHPMMRWFAYYEKDTFLL